MAKQKYYAVKIGKIPGIYNTWVECEAQVKGISGAKYKSFGTIEEAEKFITEEDCSEESSLTKNVDVVNDEVEIQISRLKNDEVIAFVDGSYNAEVEKSGFGVIIIDHNRVETPLYKAFTKKLSPEFIELRNVAAELEGVKEAINWAIAYSKKHIIIYYDYEGIEKWAIGEWKASKELTRKYVTFIKEKSTLINIDFIKVPAHSGITYNEMVDELAKNSLLEKGYKTYNDGSIYFVGYKVDDWMTIIDCINGENVELVGEENDTIKVDKSADGNRERLVISNKKSRVVINCYLNFRSYVQGKQSVLFEKIISLAIELMNSGQKVIETLNHIHVLTLTQADVENKFEQLLPNYNGERKDKHYNNLLSAVYNTMLTGYMPDYTSLITPIFRSYEYYLHKILGNKMGLNTCDRNGKNNFAYFQKNAVGKYECTSNEKAILTNSQLDYLNDLYNSYHGIRHPYTHWSADDYDTAVITDIEVSKQYLTEGLTLADKYYILF